MLETTYYILAIITMSVFLAMLIGVCFVIIRMKRKMDEIKSRATTAAGFTVAQMVFRALLGAVKKRR